MHVYIQKVKGDCYMQNSMTNFPLSNSMLICLQDKAVEVTIEKPPGEKKLKITLYSCSTYPSGLGCT